MKECEQIGDLFSELHDQEFEGEIEKAAREHLRNCPGCREEFKWYEITVQALTQLERVNPPDNFLDQLNVRLQTCSPTYSFRNPFRNLFSVFPQLPVPVGVTALTLAVAVAWGVYSYTPPVSVPTSGMQTIAYVPSESARNTLTSRHETVPHKRETGLDPFTARIPRTTSTDRSAALSPHAARPHALAKSLNPNALTIPTSANSIGSDRLTVESPSINTTVESLKRVLPHLQGTLVEEQTRDGMRETVLAVRIPPQSWPHLTTELINHGAVAVASADDQSPSQSEAYDNRNVLIRIHVVNTH